MSHCGFDVLDRWGFILECSCFGAVFFGLVFFQPQKNRRDTRSCLAVVLFLKTVLGCVLSKNRVRVSRPSAFYALILELPSCM
jgi:hypothetical protein